MTEPRIIFVGNGAVLIAEMLEALKAVVAASETGFPEALAMARSAISKAEDRS